ncbi:MAG: SDR family NAD(P)-dependent oxidoreductase [Candidatus Puniceispirillaceae bacterium]
MSKTLKGKKAVVTGAGRGIGRSIALAFAREGADIAICARSQDALDDTAQAIKAFGVDCLCMPVDIADERAVSRFTEKVEQTFGQVNILVNNAGVYLDQGRFEDSDPEQWWTTIEINIKGPYLITRHLVSAMPEGSKILNLSSGKGFSAGQNSSAYHISKAGLNMFTEALANELWERKIDVNTLVPGPTATTTLSRQDPGSGVTTDEILEKFTKAPPSGLPPWERVKHPDNVAALALQIVSYPIGGPTGQVFSLARRPL